MERDAAIALLPAAYAIALRLRDGGTDHDGIAAELGIDASALASLLRIGEDKLRRLLAD